MAPGLVDQYGNALRSEDLLQEQAAPMMIGVRSVLSRHVTTGMEPERLAAVMKDADFFNADSYLCLAEELEEKDLHYRSVLSTRKMAVSQLDITVEPASDSADDVANAQIIETWLQRDTLEAELFDIQDAIGKGYSAAEIIWDVSENQWMPKSLDWRDPRWFRFDRADGRTLQLREVAGYVDLLPYKFIIHKPRIKSGIPIRAGVARPCAWMWLFKNFSVKDWVVFNEVYGQPMRVGKYGPRASDEDRRTLLRAVSNIGTDASAIIPESMQIEFIQAQGTASTDGFKALIDMADQQMSKCIIGQTTTTDAISGGHAVSKEHNDVRGDIERADAKQLAATLNRDLVIPIITLNRGPQKAYPRVYIGRAEDVDIKAVADVATQMVNTGMKISARKLRDRVLPGLEPDDDTDVLTPSASASVIPDNGQPTESATARHDCASTHSVGNGQADQDAIDELANQMAADWEPVMKPIADQIRKAVDESTSYEDLKQRLLVLAGPLDIGPAGEALAKALFSASIAGQLDARIGREE